MNSAFAFLLMIFLHIVDDYYMQGVLSNMKQRQWWEQNAPQKMYRYDYIWALLMHSFSWSFMIMLPAAILAKFAVTDVWVLLFVANMAAHAIVDQMKANDGLINLWKDQLIHLAQIFITAGALL